MPNSIATVSPKHAEPGRAAVALAAAALVGSACAGEWSGDAGVEYRAFVHSAPDPAQHGANVSLYLQPEWFHDWDEDRQRVVFAPFLRLDEGDSERSHADLREFYWRRSFATAELYVGLRRVFWGVTESAHLVDIVNQTDLVENLDGEDKLGQPMLAVSLLRDWGTVDLYLLPYFRERTFAGRQGRLRAPLYIDESAPSFESGAGRRRLDASMRWSHYIGDWDIGISHFSGTSRDPDLLVQPTDGAPVLAPYYAQIEQSSLDVQATKGSWLWKVEAFHRTGQGQSFQALAAGFEHTLVGIGGTALDLGLIAEYLYNNSADPLTIFDDDIAVGFRLAFNDVQSTELLAFSGIDIESRERFTSVEGSRRLGQRWKLNLEARFFSATQAGSALHALRNDDYLELALARYF